MGIELVVIDHHAPKNNGRTYNVENLTIPIADDREEFIGMVRDYLTDSYDLILADQDPDGSIATAIYGLSTDNVPEIHCIGGELNARDLRKMEKDGIKKVLCMDWHDVYYSDLSEADSVTVLNPVFSGLSHTVCTTQNVYEAVRPNLKNGSKDSALALATIGIASDYCTTEPSHYLFQELAEQNSEDFDDVLKLLTRKKLNEYSIFDTEFKKLSEMMWAPYIFEGSSGSEEMIKHIIDNPGFSVGGLLRGSRNAAVRYIREQWEYWLDEVDAEWVFFEATAIEDGDLIIYEPRNLEYLGFVQKFSSMIADEYDDKVVLVRIPQGKGTKYSLRRRKYDIDLGEMLAEMGYSGGHPEAAGCIVQDPKVFEEEIKRHVASAKLDSLLKKGK